MKTQWQEFIDSLWSTHATFGSPSRNFMSRHKFEAACEELIDEVGKRIIEEIKRTPTK